MAFKVFATIVALVSTLLCNFSQANAHLVPFSLANCTTAQPLPYCCPRPDVGADADGQRRPFNPDTVPCTFHTNNTCTPDRSFCCRQTREWGNDTELETRCHWAMTDAIPNAWVERSVTDYEQVAAAKFLATQCKIECKESTVELEQTKCEALCDRLLMDPVEDAKLDSESDSEWELDENEEASSNSTIEQRATRIPHAWGHLTRRRCIKHCVRNAHHDRSDQVVHQCAAACDRHECWFDNRCTRCVWKCAMKGKSEGCEKECRVTKLMFHASPAPPLKRDLDEAASASRQLKCAEVCESLGGKDCSSNCHRIQHRSVDSCVKQCGRNGGSNCEEDCKRNQCFLSHDCGRCVKECSKNAGHDCIDFCSPHQPFELTNLSNSVPLRPADDRLYGSCVKRCLKLGGEEKMCSFECRDNTCNLHHYCRECVRKCIKNGEEDCRYMCTEKWIKTTLEHPFFIIH